MKRSVLFLSLAGLVAGTAFAAPAPSPTHHALSKRATQNLPSQNAKDIKAMEKRLATMNQQGLRTPAEAGTEANWLKHISISGGVAVDGNFAGRDDAVAYGGTPMAGINTNTASINDAYFNIDAQITDWVQARIGVDYTNASAGYRLDPTSTDENEFSVNQATITFSNFNQSPYYARVGEMYAPFGSYGNTYNELHPMIMPFTQVLTTTHIIGAQAGFIDNSGFYGDGYAFQNPSRDDAGQRAVNFGADLGFAKNFNGVDVNAELGYLYNVSATEIYNNMNAAGFFMKRQDALSAFASAAYRNFDLNVHFVTELTKNEMNAPRTAALDTQAGYQFKTMKHNSRVFLGWSESWNADSILPERRFLGGYSFDVNPNTTLATEVAYNRNYDSVKANGCDGFWTVVTRAQVRFA